jgi:hypothetical protein
LHFRQNIQQINQHLIQFKNKNQTFFKHPKPKPWTPIKDEYLLELNTKFPNLTLSNNAQLFFE